MEGESGKGCPLVIDHRPLQLPMPVKWREHRANVQMRIGQMEGESGKWRESRGNGNICCSFLK